MTHSLPFEVLDELIDLELLLPALSRRQRDILDGVWCGYSISEIARGLGLSVRQVYREWQKIQRVARQVSQTGHSMGIYSEGQ